MALTCSIVSLVPFDINEEKAGLFPSRYHIPASNMKIPIVVHIESAFHFVYLDDVRGHFRVRNAPDSVAKSLVDDYCSSQLGVDDNSKPGIFWVEDKITAAEALIKHKDTIENILKLQKSWMLNNAMMAENDWNRYQNHRVISDFQRKCADLIGWKSEQHEWMSPQTTMSSVTCPACNFAVAKELAFCPNCKCIINEEKYKSLTFAK